MSQFIKLTDIKGKERRVNLSHVIQITEYRNNAVLHLTNGEKIQTAAIDVSLYG